MRTIVGDLVTPDGLRPGGALVIDDAGRIAEIQPARTTARRADDIDAPGCWVLPGFIDLHVHGGGGADFMQGAPDAARQAARTHARHGTTGLLATTLTGPQDAIDRAIMAAQTVMGSRGPDEARILGIHLEGPYICPARRGAQPEEWVRPPDAAEFARWLELGAGAIRQITLAPELDGAEEVIRAARRASVIASLGHTDAKAADVQRAAAWGATQGTHVFNAMRGLHHREPGTVGAILAAPEIVAEVIADGVHLDSLIVRLILAAKGPDGVALITDAIEGAAMPDGEYSLGGFPVRVADGTASFADGTLAGSVLTMDRAFLNALRFAALTPAEAARCASATAARQLGLSDRLGRLAVGLEADLVILDPASGQVQWTIIGGQTTYCR